MVAVTLTRCRQRVSCYIHVSRVAGNTAAICDIENSFFYFGWSEYARKKNAESTQALFSCVVVCVDCRNDLSEKMTFRQSPRATLHDYSVKKVWSHVKNVHCGEIP